MVKRLSMRDIVMKLAISRNARKDNVTNKIRLHVLLALVCNLTVGAFHLFNSVDKTMKYKTITNPISFIIHGLFALCKNQIRQANRVI